MEASDLSDSSLAGMIKSILATLIEIARLLADLRRGAGSLLLDKASARTLCGGIADSTWDDYDSRGIVPASVKVGGRVFWRRRDLELWVKWGCPGRVKFETLLTAEDSRKTARSAA